MPLVIGEADLQVQSFEGGRLYRLIDSSVTDVCVTARSVKFKAWVQWEQRNVSYVNEFTVLYDLEEFTVVQECTAELSSSGTGGIRQRPPVDTVCANGAFVEETQEVLGTSQTYYPTSSVVTTTATPSGTQLIKIRLNNVGNSGEWYVVTLEVGA
jgi:hypothetical protein